MLKAVIFDMDGVIIDSEPVHAKACVDALKRIDVSIPLSYCYQFIGSTTTFTLQTIINEYKVPITVEELTDIYHETLVEIIQREGYPSIPFVIDTIKNLHENGVKLAIASSSTEEQIGYVVDYLGIRKYFQKLVSGTTVPKSKPAPDVFLKAAKELCVDVSECLIIEDSYHGVCAANAANIPVIGFVNKHSGNQDLSKACYLIEGFEEVDYNFLNKIYKRYYKEPITIATTNRLKIRELTTKDIPTLKSIFKNIYENSPKLFSDLTISFGLQNEMKDSETIINHQFSDSTFHDLVESYINTVYPFYDFGLWGVYLKDTLELIGICGIQLLERVQNSSYEISYMIDTKHQGNHYGYEAVNAVIQYGFATLHMDKIVAYVLPDNTSSIRTAEKVGMQLESLIELNKKDYLLYVINNPNN